MKINLSRRALRVLRLLRQEASESREEIPRLSRRDFVALTVETPDTDDLIVREASSPVLAVSRGVARYLSEGGHLDISFAENGEPVVRLVPCAGDKH
jgi:hypothetical protein